MAKLPRGVSGRDLIKCLVNKKGFLVAHGKGDHRVLVSGNHRVTVPLHDNIGPGLLKEILDEAGISRDEFLNEW